MAEYLSPGVYVEEFDSGPQPMEGVSTSTAGFIGLAQRGPVQGIPQLITSNADFQRTFGSYLPQNGFGDYRFLAYAVDQFFTNGGSRCYVMRVAPSDAKPATNVVEGGAVPALLVRAKNPGSWGNQIRVVMSPSSKAKTPISGLIGGAADTTKYQVKNSAGFNPGDVVVFDDGNEKQHRTVISSQDNVIELDKHLTGDAEVVDSTDVPKKLLSTCEFTLQVMYGDEMKEYENLSLNASASNHVEKALNRSDLIVAEDHSAELNNTDIRSPFHTISGEDDGKTKYLITLSGGSDGSVSSISPADFIGEDRGPGQRTGIQSFIDNDEVSIMSIPGVTNASVQLKLVAHCENLASRFAILDIPRELTNVADVLSHRDIFDTNYAAMYNPWLQVFDPLDKRNIFVPPSGSIAGIYSRSDTTRGVQKAPANEVVRGVVGLDCQYNKGEQDTLNPKGVNLIRSFTGQGIRVWGARTCSSNTLWKYVNVRRLFIFIEESIKAGTNWVVFEPNDEPLWARVSRTIEAFLTRVWRAGALAGASPAEAFYVNVGRSTMTQDDIDNGRLICVIGIAPVKPAEFVIFKITQKTSEE